MDRVLSTILYLTHEVGSLVKMATDLSVMLISPQFRLLDATAQTT